MLDVFVGGGGRQLSGRVGLTGAVAPPRAGGDGSVPDDRGLPLVPAGAGPAAEAARVRFALRAPLRRRLHRGLHAAGPAGLPAAVPCIALHPGRWMSSWSPPPRAFCPSVFHVRTTVRSVARPHGAGRRAGLGTVDTGRQTAAVCVPLPALAAARACRRSLFEFATPASAGAWGADGFACLWPTNPLLRNHAGKEPLLYAMVLALSLQLRGMIAYLSQVWAGLLRSPHKPRLAQGPSLGPLLGMLVWAMPRACCSALFSSVCPCLGREHQAVPAGRGAHGHRPRP
jgi:hypothetical protein